MSNNLPQHTSEQVEHETINSQTIEVGQWYWWKGNKNKNEEDEFACVVHVGSNYIQLRGPMLGNSAVHGRIHINDFHDECMLESDPDTIIKKNAETTQHKLREKMKEIQKLTQALGLNNERSLQSPTMENSLLPIHSRSSDINEYKHALIKAKDKSLPKLFEEMKNLNQKLAYWLSAQTVPMEAMIDKMKESTGLLKERIFHVELYSGLTEQVSHIKEGDTAEINEKLHIMQRRCYMDEECLIDYQHGGMDFRKIEQFDEWLAKPLNMHRILPFNKCIVSFKIRRNRKEYDDVINPFIKIKYDMANESTFLYIRNGDNLYRMNTSIDFGDKLFPDTSEFHDGEKIWAKVWGDDIREVIPDRLYQEMKNEQQKSEQLSEKWKKANPDEHWINNPHRNYTRVNDYEPCDPSSVYFDDIKKTIEDEAKQYNRIALIIQGLFDRSMVLHPHNRVCIWKHDDFQNFIKLVYDADRAISAGEMPDFEEYRNELNKSIITGTITVGQQEAWLLKEAQKENDRQASDYRIRNPLHYKRFQPYGNPGPGLLAKIEKYMPKTKKCKYAWEREKLTYSYYGDNKVRCTITVTSSEILNIEAYKPGDYHRFFDDPRTRMTYLKWAPLLLAAEEYHAGNLKVGDDLSDGYTRNYE